MTGVFSPGRAAEKPTAISSETLIDGRPLGRYQCLVIALCLATLVLDGLDAQLLSFAAPVILKEWSINAAAFSPAMAASVVGMTIGSAIGGKAGDRFGRRPVLIASVFGFGIATGFTALANNVVALGGLRFLCGLGFGAAIPCAMGLASEWSPQRLRYQTLGLLSIGTPLGGMAGAIFASWLIETVGWRFCFLLCSALTLILGAALLRTLAESPAFLQQRGRIEDARNLLARAFGSAAAASVIPVSESARASPDGSARSSIFSALERRTTIALCLGFFSSLFACYALTSWLPVAMTTAGIPLSGALQGSLAYTFWSIAGALGGGFLMARIGSRPTAFSGLAIAIGTLAALAALLNADHAKDGASLPFVLLLLSVAGISTGCVQALLYALASSAYPTACRATGIGAAATAGRLGGVAAILSGGGLLSLEHSQLLAFFGALAVALMVTGIALLLFNRHSFGLARSKADPAPASAFDSARGA